MRVSRRDWLTAAGLGLPVLVSGQQPQETSPKVPDGDATFLEFTPQSERAIRRGEEWLLKALHRDGGAGVDIGRPTDIGCSSMAGLALMAQYSWVTLTIWASSSNEHGLVI